MWTNFPINQKIGGGDIRKLLKTTTGPIGIYPEEYNPIGSVITEILRDGQPDGQTSSYFVL